MYQEVILDHYKNPTHAGLKAPFDAEVHHVNPSCGDELTLRVKLSDDKQTVVDVSYEATGCSISQASVSVMAEEIVGKPLPEADRLTRNNAVDAVARAILPLAHATLERIRAEELRTEVVGVDYDALCDAVKQLEATYRAGWWRAAEREGADFFLREVEALNRLNVPALRANWRDAGKIAGILRKMPVSTLRRVARTSNPMALRLMVLFNLQAGYRDGSFDKTISIPRLIHTRTSEYRAEYRAGSAA